jgi:hypothetical protein
MYKILNNDEISRKEKSNRRGGICYEVPPYPSKSIAEVDGRKKVKLKVITLRFRTG